MDAHGDKDKVASGMRELFVAVATVAIFAPNFRVWPTLASK
jgi:hypothetical protein